MSLTSFFLSSNSDFVDSLQRIDDSGDDDDDDDDDDNDDDQAKNSDYKEGLILKSIAVHSAVDKQLTNYDLRGKNANLFKL